MGKRLLTLAFALSVCLVLLAAGAAASGAPPSMLALVTRQVQGVRVLVRLDPVSLQPVPGGRVKIPLEIGLWTFSPGRSQIVFGSLEESVLRFVDLESMRLIKKFDFHSKERVIPLGWPAPRRLFVSTAGQEASFALAMVDPVTGRVLRRTPLSGFPQVVGRTPQSLVLLVMPTGPPGSIAPAQLIVAGVRGGWRVVTLDQIQAGIEVLDGGQAGVRSRFPGVAVDPDGRRAYVIGAGEPVAEIDLVTLDVTYHELVAATTPSAGEAEPAGLVRSALWVGNGLLIVWGEDRDLSQRTLRSAGLSLVDTRSWTSRTLNERATLAWVAGRTIFAYGGFAFVKGRPTGIGLRAYDVGGRERFHLFADGHIGGLGVFQDYGYVPLDRPARLYVIDLRSGKILRRVVSQFAFSFFLMEDEPRPFAG